MQDDERDRDVSPEPAPDPGGRGPVPPPDGLSVFDRVNNYILLVYAAACLLMNYSLAGLLYLKGTTALSLILPGIFSIVIPVFVLVQRSNLGFVREFSLGKPRLATMGLSLAVAAASILPVEAFSWIFERMQPPDADYISFMLSIKPKGPLSFVLVALGVVLVAAFAEELLFRGFVQRIFQRNMNPGLAVSLAGVLFALSHGNWTSLPGIAALGILFGYVFYATGNLWYPIAGHALFNLVTLVRLNSVSEEELVGAASAYPDPVWTFVSLAAFVISLLALERLCRRRR